MKLKAEILAQIRKDEYEQEDAETSSAVQQKDIATVVLQTGNMTNNGGHHD